LKVWRKQRRIW